MKTKLLVLFLGLLIFFPNTAKAGGLNVPANIKLERIECGDNSKAYAFFSWDKVSFATLYRFYSRLPQDRYTSYDEISEHEYKLGFNPRYDFYITVSAVNYPPTGPNVFGGQVSESDLSKEFFLSVKESFNKNKPYCLPSTDSLPIGKPDTNKTENPKTEVVSAGEQTNKPLPISEIFKATTTRASENMGVNLVEKDQGEQLQQAQKKVEQLAKQMETVQQQLAETQKRQSALEQLVNNLLNTIKNLFKF